MIAIRVLTVTVLIVIARPGASGERVVQPAKRARGVPRNVRPDARSTAFPRSAPVKSWDLYREITLRNIFSRNRRPLVRPTPEEDARARSEGEGSAGSDRGPADPGRDIVLVGVTKVGTRLFALFEKVREGTISPVAEGETIGGRKLKAITLDSVIGERDGTETTIPVGRALTGDIRAAGSPAGAPPADAAPSARSGEESAGSETDPEMESALERLLRRRREEQGQ